jgi:CheY-like chemotaxis protein
MLIVNVLIVDDDKELLDMVCLMLEKNNMIATCIENGLQLFAMLETSQFDVILMDIYLGNCDGRELARQIKADSRFSHIPVLLYSAGNVQSRSIGESLADDFIEKPFDMPVLIGKICKLVGSRITDKSK